MGIENSFNNDSSKSHEIAPNYSVVNDLERDKRKYPVIPTEVFDAIKTDLDNLPENNEDLRFGRGEILELAINSSNPTSYEVLDATKGHYFIAKKFSKENAEMKGTYFTSHEEKTGENPDLIVCSSKELESWLKK